jgi:hypothetical protein
MSEPCPSHDEHVLSGLFRSIAFWQAAAFVLLICFIWAHEVLDLPAQLYGQPPRPIGWFGACVETAAVIVVAFVTVAHTYVRQQKVLRGFLIVCAHCGKVKLADTTWEQLEQFVARKTLAQFSHGICPSCFEEAQEPPTNTPAEAPHRCMAEV